MHSVEWVASCRLGHADGVVPYHSCLHEQVLYRGLGCMCTCIVDSDDALQLVDVAHDISTSDSSSSLHITPPRDLSRTLGSVDRRGKEGNRLLWRDIYVETPPRKCCLGFGKRSSVGSKVILNQVSGYAEGGQMTFIMGASGAGKSTLLNVLTQRNDRDLRVFGEVAINNIVVENGNMKRYSAYVQQEDMFIAEVTVEEQLMFAARLRMPKNTTEDERKETVENLITSMGLIKCRYSRIGTATEKFISRSERKRLAFASEIITNPSILFCDEPTSGLDSFMALQALSLILGCVYYQVEFTKDSLMNYKGSAIRASLDMVFIFLYPCISVFTGELPIVIREYHAHTYHPTAFFAATNLANVPQYIILPTIYSVIVYGFAAGFFIDVRSIPIYFEIFTPLSWFKYSYEAHLIVLLRPINEIKGCPSNNTYDALICSANNGEEFTYNVSNDLDQKISGGAFPKQE
uniref:ABC transporter domain-containing protein n=1 Tax=Angiostrongylus cantonensis TaxID=6313 RepID=A0A0K0DJI0_ANGCA